MPSDASRTRFVPPQHGAWAFVLVPLVLGWSTTSPAWVLLPFSLAWVAAYPASYFALQVAFGRGRNRPVRPLVAWATAAAVLGLLALVWRPWLLWAGVVWAASFGVNAMFARRRDERSIANDLILVGQAASVLPVVSLLGLTAYAGIAPPPPSVVPQSAWALTVACALWFAGSVLHVKSLIRERRDARWMWASRWYHVVALLASAALSPWLVVPFAYALARAWIVSPARGLRPVEIGMVELVGALLLVGFGLLV